MPLKIDYSLTVQSPEFMYMFRTMCCWNCGHIVVEEVTSLGTMLTCLEGHEFENGERGCGHRWWIDER